MNQIDWTKSAVITVLAAAFLLGVSTLVMGKAR